MRKREKRGGLDFGMSVLVTGSMHYFAILDCRARSLDQSVRDMNAEI